MEKLKNITGNYVEGDRFWDRKIDIQLLIEKIESGAHILMVAQRRMGKTSLMKEIKRQLDGRYICLFVDLQKSVTAQDAIVELSLALKPHLSLWKKTRDLFSNVLIGIVDKIEEINLNEVGIKLRAGLTSGNWSEKGDAIFSILASSKIPVLLLIDEMPIMINRMLKGEDYKITPERKSSVDEVMSWLRKNSLQHQGKIRIMVSGSIGLEPVLRQAGLSATINNFFPFELKPWDESTSIGCLQALAAEYGVIYKDGAEAAMIKKLGCGIPHHVQMFFTRVYERCKRRGKMEFSSKEVDSVYKTEMLGIRGHAELSNYEERLKLVLGTELQPLALEILTEIAVTGCLTRQALESLQKAYEFTDRSVASAVEEILWVLEHDGYIKDSKRGYVFVSRLLRDWWKNMHKNTYTSILKRRI